MPCTSDDIDRLASDIRSTFQTLRGFADQLHSGSGINASMRAVLDYLRQAGPQTVPAIAAAKSVSRQHVQAIVDQLLDADLVERRANPAHKRSVLIALAPRGRSAFDDIRRREAENLDQIAKAFDPADIAAARAVLTHLRATLRETTPSKEED